MSRLHLHAPDATIDVLGSERHWFGSISDKVGMALVDGHFLTELAKWMDIDAYGRTPPGTVYNAATVDHVRLAFRFGLEENPVLTWRGVQIDPWTLTLNTAMRVGSFPVRLATRIHAQCEIHAWVDAPNLDWFAGIIVAGLRSGVMREGAGWDDAITFLRERDGVHPIVMSYSVTDGFPNAYVSTWERAPDAGDDDAWYDLPAKQQWAMSMDALRAQPGHLEITPDGFEDYAFGNGVSWLDLARGEDAVLAMLEEARS